MLQNTMSDNVAEIKQRVTKSNRNRAVVTIEMFDYLLTIVNVILC